MGKYVYKNEESMKKIHAFYDKAMDQLNVKYRELYIETTYGNTHILIVGDENKPSIITLHGGNGISPLNIRLFLPLLENFCIIAPDVIGMPGKSEPYRNLDTNKDDYAIWISEIMDSLHICKGMFAVSSYSAAMAFSLAKKHPERIEKCVLLVPSGIAHGPIIPMMWKMAVPFMKYYFKPSHKSLDSVMDTMVSEGDDLWREFLDLMMSSYKMEMRAPKEFSKKELKNFQSPILLFASDEDIFFPASKVFPRAKRIFKGPVHTYEVTGKHLPSKEKMNFVCDKISEFCKQDNL